MAHKLQQQLREVGSKLETPPASKDALIKLLKQAAGYLSELDQSPSPSILESMQPFIDAIIKPELLQHQDRDVKLLVATCICEITRITAPEAPYSDDVLKDIFHLIVGTFSGLNDTNGPSFGRRVVILETLAKYRSCVVMLDLDCDDLVNEMFSTFLAVAREDHPESVLSSMQTIMVVLLEESEDIREELLFTLLSTLGRNKSNVSSAARRLAMNVIQNSAGQLEAAVKQFLVTSMSGDNKPPYNLIDYHEVIYDIYRCAPQILSGIAPYLIGELLTDELDTRLKAVGLVGDLFSLPGSSISEVFQPVFSEFLKRLTDRIVEVRMSVLVHVKSCLLSNPLRDEASEIISALSDRLLDFDENVRKQVVAVICDVACLSLNAIPLDTIKLVAERLRDKSLLVKKYTMERLAEIYRVYSVKSSTEPSNPDDFIWIPGRILRCFYDKDFRSDIIESVLCGSLFPSEFPVKDRVKHLLRVFSTFDKVELKALEKILEQKQRLQQEMQRYLSLRQMNQDGDVPETQKKILFGFRIMSRSFADPAKSEENFQILDQLKDANVWRILSNLVDPNTNFHQACNMRDELLKILGEKHRLYDFLNSLSVKCSYLLFNKEHVKEILQEAEIQKSAGSMQDLKSSMTMLVILARFSPVLFSGSEEELINFLKDDNETIKEGILHVLAKAGGTIREQLAVSSSSIDLILERLCLEGTRRQAKYAVHALAAITKDDGLKSLSVLYKRLVDMLEERSHLPAVLQSLGCIAQTAMPVFETRENEIEEFIRNNILKCNSEVGDNAKTSWENRSELCLLKIFAIKTLVKSYLPVKDAHLRLEINNLLEILGNILAHGEISQDIESSSVDKAHLKLASAKAILRLSKQWDDKMPINIFHLTLKTSEITFPQARKAFLSKVHQYIKDRMLDAKYACAFLFNITGSNPSEFDEEKQNLADIIQMHHQAKARQLSMQSETNSTTAYPEYIITYLVHALAHHTCPDVDECKDVKEYELVYRRLHFILSLLVHKDDDVKSEANTTKEKENISAIFSIFHSIKNSEDIVDAAKSKNSYAICDLGLSIMKRLALKEDDSQGLTDSVSLPAMLYKTKEKKEGDESVAGESEGEAQTWLVDENVLAHFESLKLEATEAVSTEAAADVVQNKGERDGNDVPLGKMIKGLKSHGRREKRNKKVKKKHVEKKTAENDVDILTMVREINLSSIGITSKHEPSNGHEDLPGKRTNVDAMSKSRKRKTSDATSLPVPKHQRSSSDRSRARPKSRSKARSSGAGNTLLQGGVSPLDSSEIDMGNNHGSDDDISKEKKIGGNSESELLVSSLKKATGFSAKPKVKGSGMSHSDQENDLEDFSDLDVKHSSVLKKVDKNNTNNLKSLSGAIKKRKRRSIAGLAKCMFKYGENDIEDLIGCRIKVWWPMDKKFYKGTVKSYDPIKRKHVVLYDDGDVEVLRLEKERWEIIGSDQKSSKKLKLSRSLPSFEVKLGLKNKDSGGSHSIKKPFKITKGKRTPKKNLKLGQNGASKIKFSDAGEKVSSDISNPGIAKRSNVHDEMDSGDSEGEHTQTLNKELTDREDSDREIKSGSRGSGEGDHHIEESDGEEKPDVDDEEDKPNVDDEEEKPDVAVDELDEDPESSEKHADNARDEKAHKEDKEADESSSRENIDDDDNSDSDSGKNQGTIVEQSTPIEEQKGKAEELSDEEPLSKWKHRAGKRGLR
ncbi:sister chromatid cohesion protein PDS5 homolog A isoform X2 [Momordica charantia]|uniref:Sister chromatid cohesion protein PDS5 homolog A isoform X2 n=1 Tax=Momordica charantia TaxID=3673 RepID=A0A6J1CNF5_MOMCH|nr:sister chromatid cohesion protein PDS5 homolog A isoform X2 [Momordica charantia]